MEPDQSDSVHNPWLLHHTLSPGHMYLFGCFSLSAQKSRQHVLDCHHYYPTFSPPPASFLLCYSEQQANMVQDSTRKYSARHLLIVSRGSMLPIPMRTQKGCKVMKVNK